MDGVLIDLLKTKWNTFVKSRFYRQFYLFASYFIVSLVSFTLRPGPVMDDDEEGDDDGDKDNDSDKGVTIIPNINQINKSLLHLDIIKMKNIKLINFVNENDDDNPFWYNTTELYPDDNDNTNRLKNWWSSYSECRLMSIDSLEHQIRLISEIIIFIGALLYIIAALRESRFLGYKMFIENLVNILLVFQNYF